MSLSEMDSSKNFLASETIKLVKVYCDPDWQRKFENHKKSQKHVWNELAAELERNHGIQRTGEQCQNKIKNLKKEFFRIKRLPTGSGRVDWPYYEDFAQVFGGSAMLNPVSVIDSFDSDSDLVSVEGGESDFTSDFDPTSPESAEESFVLGLASSTSKSALDSAKRNAEKRKKPGQKINEFLKKSEEEDKRSAGERSKIDAEFLAEMKRMNDNMAELVAVKKQKLEQTPYFQMPFFQPPSPHPPGAPAKPPASQASQANSGGASTPKTAGNSFGKKGAGRGKTLLPKQTGLLPLD